MAPLCSRAPAASSQPRRSAVPQTHTSARCGPARLPGLLHPSNRALAFPPSASAAVAELAGLQTNFPPRALRPAPPAWFQGAVREVVRHLEDAPFLQLVRFAAGGSPSSGAAAQYATYSVPRSVVAAPELWAGVAETVSSDSPDVVIMVQRVMDPHAGAPAAAAAAPSSQPSEPCTCADADLRRLNSDEMRAHVEEACRQLVASGVGRSMLTGQVGECCEDEGGAAQAADPARRDALQAAVLPFSRPAIRRSAVRMRALPAGGATAAISGFWGVVVQSRHHTGAEGCYLLKAVRSVPSATEGCSCTHFSLTRVCQGENVARQFVESWLA